MAAKLGAFIRRDFLQATSYRFSFLSQFGSMFLVMLSLFFLSTLLESAFLPQLEAYGGDYFSFVLIGISMAIYTSMALHSLRKIIRSYQTRGTLEALLGTRTGLPTILLGSSLYGLILGTVQVVGFLVLGVVVFGAQIGFSNAIGAVIAMLLTIAAMVGIGIISSAFIIMFKKGDPVSMVVNGGNLLLAGVVYPVAVLPTTLQYLSKFLPMSHGLEAMRMALLTDADLADIVPSLLTLGAFAAVLIPVSLLFFEFSLNRAKLEGSLSHY